MLGNSWAVALDARALARAFDALVERHESLRTTFAVMDGAPVQVIAEAGRSVLRVIDVSDAKASEREATALERAAEETRQPFDLERGPLFRVSLLRIAEQEHLLVIALHHIISDGWSMRVLERELCVLYRAFAGGQASPLADLPVQYADFAHWQREWLQGDVLEEQLAFWRTQLEGASALELPIARRRPPIPTFEGAEQAVRIPRAQVEALHALGRSQGVTLFMTLFGAFQLLLHRYTGQVDIVIGTPIANRNRSKIEGLVGCFVNSLALRVDLSGDPTVRQLLQRVREVALGAYDHQDLPFEKLVEELQLEREMSQNPLFQAILSLQNEPGEEIQLPGLTVTGRDLGVTVTRLDLELHLREGAEGLTGSLVYNTAWSRRSMRSLSQVVPSPTRPQIPSISSAMCSLGLPASTWTQTAAPSSSARCHSHRAKCCRPLPGGPPIERCRRSPSCTARRWFHSSCCCVSRPITGAAESVASRGRRLGERRELVGWPSRSSEPASGGQ